MLCSQYQRGFEGSRRAAGLSHERVVGGKIPVVADSFRMWSAARSRLSVGPDRSTDAGQQYSGMAPQTRRQRDGNRLAQLAGEASDSERASTPLPPAIGNAAFSFGVIFMEQEEQSTTVTSSGSGI